MTENSQIIAVMAGAVASVFGLLRVSLAHHRSMANRFVGFLEENLQRQEIAGRRLALAVEGLRNGITENTKLLRAMAKTKEMTDELDGNQGKGERKVRGGRIGLRHPDRQSDLGLDAGD